MSVVEQTTDIEREILVGVDKSSDNTLSIVQRLVHQFPDLIRCIEHKKRLGAGAKNLQLVLKEAKGDLVAHLDGDDYWCPEKLDAQVCFLRKHPDCPAVYTNANVVDETGSKIGTFTNWQPERFSLEYLIARGNFLNHSSILYRAEFKHLLLDLTSPFVDYQIHILLAQEGDLGFINTNLATYQLNSPVSMRFISNEQVRELYWQALMSMDDSLISRRAFIHGKSEILGQAVISSLENRDTSYLTKWWQRVSKTENNRRIDLIFYTIGVVARRLMLRFFVRLGKMNILRGERIFHVR